MAFSPYDVALLSDRLSISEKSYLEFIRETSMSVGLYELKAGQQDLQKPHTEDEVYVVLRGRAQFSLDTDNFEVGAGTVIFVPALVEHRFHSIIEDLQVLVLFAPPEHSHKEGGVDATG